MIIRFVLILVAGLLMVSTDVAAQSIIWKEIAPSKPGIGLHLLTDSTFLSLESSWDGPFPAYLNRTTNSGKNWTTESPWGVPSFTDYGETKGVTVVGLHFLDYKAGIAFGGLNLHATLFQTADAGYSWSEITPKLNYEGYAPMTRFLDADPSFIYFSLGIYLKMQQAVFRLSKTTRKWESLFSIGKLDSLGFKYVTSLQSHQGYEYILGGGVDNDLRLSYRKQTDTSLLPSIRVEGIDHLSARLKVIDEVVSFINGNAIVRITPSPFSLDTLVQLPNRILDVDRLSGNRLVASLAGPPYIMLRTSDTQWTPQGNPALSPDPNEVRGDAIFTSDMSGAIVKGTVSDSGNSTTQLYLAPYRRSITLPSMNSSLELTTQLQNFDQKITAIPLVRSKNKIEFSVSTITLEANTDDSIRIHITGQHPGTETALIGMIVDGDTIVLGEWQITTIAPALRTADTITLSRIYRGHDAYCRVPLHNAGDDTLIVTSLRSHDGSFAWDDSLEIAPQGTQYIYLPEPIALAELGKLIVTSNSPLAEDTLYYHSDTASLRPLLRHVVPFQNYSAALDYSILGIAHSGTSTFVALGIESDDGDRHLRISRSTQPDQFYTIQHFNGTKAIGNDKLLSLGMRDEFSLTAHVLLDNATAVGQHQITTYTLGSIKAFDTIRGSIEVSYQSGDHLHLRTTHPSWFEAKDLGRGIEHGASAFVRSQRYSIELKGGASYDSRSNWSNGDAYGSFSAVDSNGHVYMIGRQDRGTGSYNDRENEYHATLVSSREVKQTPSENRLDIDQLEVTPAGRLVMRKFSTFRLLNNDGKQLFQQGHTGFTQAHTAASESVFASRQGDRIELIRLDGKGNIAATYRYSSAPYVKHEIRRIQILRNDHAYVLIAEGPDLALLHFDSVGVLLNSVHLDGGYFREDNAVQFIRTDSQVIVAMNTTNESGGREGVLYYFDWEHSLASPTKQVAARAPRRDALEIFPNPARDLVTIGNLDESRHMRIIDVLGVEWPSTISGQHLDVSHLPVGIYTLEAGTHRTKLVIQR